MPYISIKAYPRDDEAVDKLAQKIKDDIVELWGCPAEAVTISFEAVALEEWEEKVRKPQMLAHPEKLRVLDGKKTEKNGGTK
jgi:phenylpyruvate tautomerase PptA (4-oxalocrotonate tautomerase family)